MGIWIMSQDKKTLVQSTGITIKVHQDYDKTTYHIENISPIATLGVYESEERAKEILGLLTLYRNEENFYDMPEN